MLTVPLNFASIRCFLKPSDEEGLWLLCESLIKTSFNIVNSSLEIGSLNFVLQSDAFNLRLVLRIHVEQLDFVLESEFFESSLVSLLDLEQLEYVISQSCIGPELS